MKGLRLIGYWASEANTEWPDVTHFVDTTWDEHERFLVGLFLGGGIPTPWTCAGFSTCRFCEKPNGTGEATDGTYVWPEGLAHYVFEHDVRLPREFVNHVVAVMNELEHGQLDDTWWLHQRSA